MQLNVKAFLERAQTYFPKNEIVSRRPDGSLFRYTYGDMGVRARRLASRLGELGIRPGDKVATFAWNSHRHYELYFAIPSYGAVLHTVNIRLADEHIAYIINHSEDVCVFADPDLLPTLERIAPQLNTVKAYVILGEEAPDTPLAPVYLYEDLLRDGDPELAFGELDENAPAVMCYTSATTGNPKGVLYTHRGIYLHTSVLCFADTFAISEPDTFLPIVPMFHANAWGIPFATAWMGSKMVLPGERPRALDILELMESEQVTLAAAPVSVGIDMIGELQKKRRDLSSLRALLLGGQATPKAVMDFFLAEFGVPIYTAWGATETTPIATFAHVKRHQLSWSDEEKIGIRVRQGMAAPGVEIKVLDDDGNRVPWDDQRVGEVYARTPWGATSYYNDERSAEGFVDGWWKSGDVAAIDPEGVLRLVDRAKDLIKSGGEWISSIDLENALMAHPGIREAAVVAMPHERWLERPVAYVVRDPEAEGAVGESELLEWLGPMFAKWWLPDRFVFVDEIPKTGVGKFNKRALREEARLRLK